MGNKAVDVMWRLSIGICRQVGGRPAVICASGFPSLARLLFAYYALSNPNKPHSFTARAYIPFPQT